MFNKTGSQNWVTGTMLKFPENERLKITQVEKESHLNKKTSIFWVRKLLVLQGQVILPSWFNREQEPGAGAGHRPPRPKSLQLEGSGVAAFPWDDEGAIVMRMGPTPPMPRFPQEIMP